MSENTPQGHVNPAVPGQPSAAPGQTPSTPVGTYIKTAIWTIVAIYVILFVILNREQVSINFVFFQMDIALIFVLIGLLIIGAGLGVSWVKMRARKAVKQAAPKK